MKLHLKIALGLTSLGLLAFSLASLWSFTKIKSFVHEKNIQYEIESYYPLRATRLELKTNSFKLEASQVALVSLLPRPSIQIKKFSIEEQKESGVKNTQSIKSKKKNFRRPSNRHSYRYPNC